VKWCLEAGIVKPEATAVARQQLGKHVPMAMNTCIRIEELLDAVTFMWSIPRLCTTQFVMKGKSVISFSQIILFQYLIAYFFLLQAAYIPGQKLDINR
jgi:hypothetical protein